jgi:GNAT superfamily N-acetyltransferase
MWWRQSRADFERYKGEPNRQALERITQHGPPPGLLAYRDGEPAGWCAVAPRSDYPALARSRVLKPVDDQPVWSISCFYIGRRHRRQGVMAGLLDAAADYAAAQGATLVEGYPVDPAGGYPDAYAFTGLVSAFRRAGFQEVARRSPTRPIMRRIV